MTTSPSPDDRQITDTGMVDPHAAHHDQPHHPRSFWLFVMCLTGVDYFSTLGYQPSIAFNSLGVLAPIATIVLVLVTLFGALPVYKHVAASSPHGQGSIAMLERLMHGWNGKILVLALLGFAATDFVITMTLSAADAAEHMLHNPLWEHVESAIPFFPHRHHQMAATVGLLVLLGGVFMRGFREVINIAVIIVAVYLTLNIFVIGSGLVYLVFHPAQFAEWYQHLTQGEWYLHDHEGNRLADVVNPSWWMVIGLALLYFPKLALGLSGFETGVAVMPLIEGDPDDDHHQPAGRIRNARKLLTLAAVIMSIALLGSSLVTTTLIAPEALEGGGGANNRALAYIAHGESHLPINPVFGEVFGTIYDLATIVILSFAGMSAMAGLLNIVPQYLPRYGMAPEWARAIRPLVLLFTGANLLVTWIFNADVEAQGGAYATGVLVLICSACIATVIDLYRQGDGAWYQRVSWRFLLITGVFFYTAAANMIERPDGIKIATWFIVAIVLSSFASRIKRSTELRFIGFEFADLHSKFLWDSLKHLEFPVLVPHRPGRRGLREKEAIIRERHRLGPDTPIVFIEAMLGDPSEFQQMPLMEIAEEDGRFIISVTRCNSIAHVIASIALELSRVGTPPEIHFGWSDENPLGAAVGFFLFGEGNVPVRVRELIRKAQPETQLQPQVFLG